MSYRKIAAAANVSVSTVSKAFSNSSEISSETRERIFAAAKELGLYDKYFREIYPRKIVAVICPELYSRYYAIFAEIFERELRSKNIFPVLSSTGFDLGVENSLIEYYTSYAKADAVIVLSPANKHFASYSIPIVTVQGDDSHGTDCITTPFEAAFADAFSLLIKNGHSRIGFIGENLTTEREKLFRAAARQMRLDINPEYITRSGSRFEDAGRDGAKALLSLDKPPTAIIAGYDYIALGAMEEIRAQGLSVPEDISIIGIDDINDVSHIDTPLTTIRIHMEEIASVATDIILKKIEHPAFKIIQQISIPAELVVRSTVAGVNSPL